MTTQTVAKKDIQKLQRAIVDGLEDVKAQDIQVFDTEHLSALFERVIVASGTSNRQTKALAASVRDAVREAGFSKPRVEGEANGEWIIVDCGQAVVHIMQPSFRQYYHLEELWGEKPVRLKFGAAKPEAKEPADSANSAKPLKAASGSSKSMGDLKRSNAAKKGVAEAFPSKAQVRKSLAAKAAAAKSPSKAVKKAPGSAAARAPAQPVRRTPVKSAPISKVAVTKVTVTKVTVNAPVKAAAKKPMVKPSVRTTAKAPAKTTVKASVKAPAKKAPARKTAASRN